MATAPTPTSLEAALTDNLRSAFAPIPVNAWPDDIERYQLRGAAEILVGYRGGPWEAPQHGTAAQVRTVTLEIGLACKSLTGHQGATRLLEELAQHLQGLRLLGAQPVRIVEDRYHGRVPGAWWYGLKVAIPGVVAVPKLAPLAPTLTRVRVRTDAETLEIV